MSTRSTTHFIDSSYINPDTKKPYLSAIIYRHTDGYPEGAGTDIFRFLERVSKLNDTRLSDPSYLAAKYVMFLAEKFGSGLSAQLRQMRYPTNDSLDFLSVGVVMDDPSDIRYRYIIDCGKIGADGLPEVTCFDTEGNKHDIPRKS